MYNLHRFYEVFWLLICNIHFIDFEGLNSLKTLNSNQNIKATNIIASTGIKIEKTDITIDVPVSTVEITGFAIPAVVADDAKRVVLVEPFIAAAVPPPAIIANAQVIAGSKSLTVATITAVPAIAAKGTAIVSNKLSKNGIKYAKISTIVAAPKVTIATELPTHCQLSFNGIILKWEAKLSANNGTKILKPTDAANPIPIKILIIISGVKFI